MCLYMAVTREALDLGAAGMKVIFELPAEYERMAHPAMYVEWYIPSIE